MPLPEPVWTDNLSHCPGCAYALAGITRPAPCPECGQALPAKALVFHGVPRGVAGASRSQMLVLYATVGGIFIVFQLWPLAIFALRWVGALAFMIMVFGGLTFLFMKARGARSGATRYVLFPGRLSIEPVEQKEPTGMEGRTILPLAGGETYALRRVHPILCRLKIFHPGGRVPLLDTGVRCLPENEPALDEGLRTVLSHSGGGPAGPSGISSDPMKTAGATTTTRHDSHA